MNFVIKKYQITYLFFKATSTSTSTTGAGVINTLTSYFRKGGVSKGLRKKKKKKYKSAGTIQADLGIGNIKGLLT